jgi:hypothetical protein
VAPARASRTNSIDCLKNLLSYGWATVTV